MERICGIYEIRNKVNNKVYIGQSRNISRRWNDHVRELNNNIHDNYHLQQSWNLYGKENFRFTIVALCSADELNELEAFYIDKMNSMNSDYGYNIRFVDDNDVYTYNDEGLKHLSDAHEFQFRPVNQYDDEKNKLFRYKSLKEASRCNDIDVTGIRNNAVFNSQHKRLWKYKNSYWLFDEDCEWFEACNIDEYRDLSKFKVNKYEFPSGKYICQYNSIKEASKDNDVTVDVISLCIRQAQNHSGGYTYRNADNYEVNTDIIIDYKKKPSASCKPVLCLDAKTGFIIKEYPSALSAKNDGFSPSHITEVCNGKRKTCGGFKWKYKDVKSAELTEL